MSSLSLRQALLCSAAYAAFALVHPAQLQAQTSQNVINGGGTGGYIVTTDSGLSATNSNILDSNVTAGSSSTQTVYTDFATVGGSGSGGGAGLGGVFFVDQNSTLTLNNVSFNNNTTTGGQGGGVRADSVAAAAFSVSPTTTDASAFQVYGGTPTVNYNSGSGAVTLTGLTLSQSNSLFGTGSGVALGSGSYTTNIASTTANADGSETLSFTTPMTLTNGNGLNVVTMVLGLQVPSSSSATSIQSGMPIVGNGIPAGVTVGTVTTNSSGNITSFTAVDANGNAYTLPTTGSYDVVNSTSYDVSRVATSVNGSNISNTLVSTGALTGFYVGMTVTGTGVPTGTTVTNVSTTTDPTTGNTITTVTLSNPINLLNATTLKASYNPLVSNTGQAVFQLQSVAGLAVGQVISATGLPAGTTITAINGNDVTLSNPLGTAGLNQLTQGALVLSASGVVSSVGSSVTLTSVSGLRVGDALTGDSRIPANAQITSINTTTDTVTYIINPALATANTGGSMNGLKAYGSVGSKGSSGQTGTWVNAYLFSGEGSPGTNGSSATNGTNAAGGNGGNGGSGSSGSPVNPGLVEALAFDIANLVSDFLRTDADGADLYGLPDTPADIAHTVLDTAHVVLDTVNEIAWQVAEVEGLVALGGPGGGAGNGGNGSDYFGGGAGGIGGAGGNSASSSGLGGAGGSGGAGGAGGFGAGGGTGGAGGQPGDNGLTGSNGAGGAAGFGGGTGSVAGADGAGGSGYGGAVFVRDGGTLIITGNAVYQNNSALGGSSSNGGAAGGSAGNDLFIMTGASVTMAPGAGNTITFYDSIADDSAASISGSSIAAGQGASITITGGGTVQFFGTNTYSGATNISGATLEAQDGVGINPYSQVLFSGAGSIGNGLSFNTAGVLLSGGTFIRPVGSQPVDVNWTGSGGFAATSAGLTVNLGLLNGGTRTMTWNSGGFVPTGSTLIFGSDATDATGTVTFVNPINLNGQNGQIAVYHNSGNTAAYDAVMAGAVYGGTLTVGDTGYTGTLLMPAQNSLTGLTLNDGTLSTIYGSQIGRLFDPTNGGSLTINGGDLILGGAEKLTTVSIAASGNMLAEGAITAGAITNSGIMTFASTLNAASIANNGGLTLDGATTVTGAVTNNSGGLLYQNATASAASADNEGIWELAADLTTSGSVTNNGEMDVIGSVSGTPAVETAATRTINTAGFTGGTTGVVNLGGITGNVDNTLVINQSGASTYAGSFTGAGGLTKTGSGYLTLTGASTFTGALAINGGTLDTTGGGTFASAVNATVGTAGTFIVGTDDVITSINNSGNTAIYANLGLATATNNRSANFFVFGSLTSTGDVGNAGYMDFETNSGETIGGALNNTGILASTGTLSVTGQFTNAANATATFGSAGSSVFGSASNTGSITESSSFTVTGAMTNNGGGSITASAPFTVDGAMTNSSNGTITWNEGSAPWLGSLTNSGIITANDAVYVKGAYTQNAGSLTVNYNPVNGPISLNTGSFSGTGGAVILNSGLWTITQTADGSYSGTVSGTGDVTKYGSATLSLTGAADSFAPAEVTVDQGALTVVNASILDAALPVTTDAAGTLNVLANQSFASLTNNGTTNLVADITTSGLVTNNNDLNVIGTLNGSVETAATRTINTAGFTGSSSGVVDLGGISGNVDNTLVINQSGASTYAGIFAGAGGLTKTGSGYLTLTGASTFTGPLTVNGGTLDTTGGGTFASAVNATVGTAGTFIVGTDDTISSINNSGITTINANLDLATVTNTATGTFTVNGSLTSSGAVSNADKMTFATGSSETIGGALSNTASLNSAGTLEVYGLFTNASGATATLGSAGSSVFGSASNTGTLTASSPFTVTGLLTNNTGGSVTFNTGSSPHLGSLTNSGTMTSNVALTVQGAYTQNAGSLTANAGLATGSLSGSGGTINLANGSAYNLNQTTNGTYSGAISGTGGVNKSGTGTLTLAGGTDSISPNYFNVTGGQVIVANANELDKALTVAVSSGAELTLDASQTISNLSGAGVLNVGSNTLTVADGSGTFTGQVNGTGDLAVTGGSIQLTNPVNLSTGSMDVTTGTVYVSTTTTASTTNVSGDGSLILGNGLDIGTTGATVGTLNSDVTVTNGGYFGGDGTINGTLDVGQGGTAHPGNSPGIITVTNLIFGNGSTAAMTVNGTAGAGLTGGFSQFVVSDALTLQPGSSMVITKSVSGSVALSLGQQAQLFDFGPGKVSGYFGSVSVSGYGSDFLFNVPTGTLIGLGSYTPSSFASAVATTPNERSLMNALLVNSTGGVPQYYGGNLMGYLTQALASGQPGAVDQVFARWSPEGYAAVTDQMQLAVLHNLRDLSSYDTLVPGTAYAFGNSAASGMFGASQGGYAQSHFSDASYSGGFAYQLPFAELSLWYGGSTGSFHSTYMQGNVDANQIFTGVSVPVALDQQLRITGLVGYGADNAYGTRYTNSGGVGFKNVGGDNVAYAGGLAYHRPGDIRVDVSAQVIGISESLNSFSETRAAGGSTNPLDVMTIGKTSTTPVIGQLHARVGEEVFHNFDAYIGLNYDHEMGPRYTRINGSVSVESVGFSVENPGLARDRVAAEAGFKYTVIPNLDVNISVQGGTDSSYQAGGGIRYTF